MLLVTSMSPGGPAWAAGGHYVVDDATMVQAGRCQFETWLTAFEGGGTLLHLTPACRPMGDLELTLSAALDPGEPELDNLLFQGKTLFRSLDASDFGFGVTAGGIQDIAAGRLDSLYAFVPMTRVFTSDGRLLVHLNLGWEYDRPRRRHLATWGLGGDLGLRSWLHAIAEIHGSHDGDREAQAGLRYTPASDRFDLDLSLGRDLRAGSHRWYTLGLALRF